PHGCGRLPHQAGPHRRIGASDRSGGQADRRGALAAHERPIWRVSRDIVRCATGRTREIGRTGGRAGRDERMAKRRRGDRPGGAPRRASLTIRLAAAVGRLFTAPFTGDPELANLPADLRERRRRAALLRLIIACIMTVQLAVGLPLAILNDSPPAAIV